METKDLLDEIYPLIQRQSPTAFPELGFKQASGGWIATQGAVNGQNAKGHVYHYTNSPFCFVNHKTGEKVTLWEYIQTARGLANQETLRELANLAGYTLPQLEGYSEEKAKEAQERASIMEASLQLFTGSLGAPKGKGALSYLLGRGYTEDELKKMELGHFPPAKELEKYLVSKGYSVNTVNNSGLLADGRLGGSHVVAIPYRDAVGRLKGFIVRAIDSTDPKYLYTKGLALDSLFNIHNARGEKTLTLVEGPLDALIASTRGLPGVVGLGRAFITEAQLEGAIKLGAQSIVLALDNDEAGRNGTEKAVETLLAKGLSVFVATIPEGKDPDGLIKAKGINAFAGAIENAEAGAKWKAQSILSKHSLQTDRGKQGAIDEGIAFEETLRDPIASKDFLDRLTMGLGISPEYFAPLLKDYHEKKAQERLKSNYQEYFREGSKLLSEGKLPELRRFTDERLQELHRKNVKKIVRPYTLGDLRADIRNSQEGLKTGFPGMDEVLSIPQEAITIVAGRPSHGKTTILLNLLLSMSKAYPERSFVFFSYEETKKQLAIKLLNILSGDLISEKANIQNIENYLRGGKTDRELLRDGQETLEALTQSGRILLVDEPYFVDELAETIAYLSEGKKLGAVFIDYIQKIKIKGRYSTRQVEIQKISETILETAKGSSVPIILGAQLGRDKERSDKVRLDNLRESGDIEQDANLVLGIYNKAMEKAQDEGGTLTRREVELSVTILKNRNGVVNEEIKFTFDRPLLRIIDSKQSKQGLPSGAR